MVVAIGVWSLVLTPGNEPEVVTPQGDLRITNIALGDVLADASGRTTVKLTYRTLIDSDSEDDEVPLSTTILSSLTPGKIEQSTIDIVLEEDQEYLFEVVGKNSIYLSGNYIDQVPPDNMPFGDDSDSDGSEEAFDLRDVSSDVEVDPAELDSDASRFEEVEEAVPKSLKRPRASDAMDTDAPKPSKADKKLAKKLKGEDGKAVAADSDVVEEEKKSGKAKKDKAEKQEGSAKGEKPEKSPAVGVTREVKGGLKIKDTTIGTGPMAKKGNTVLMRYIGKLQNGKVFDKNTKGKPFTFHLGKGEVIKGWDEGIVGMQVGGERLLTVPPNMGYGKKSMEGIPANSTLIFECKLMEIK